MLCQQYIYFSKNLPGYVIHYKWEASVTWITLQFETTYLFLNFSYEIIAFDLNWGSVSTQGSEHLIDGKKYPAELQIRLFNQKYQGEKTCNISSDCAASLTFPFEVSKILIKIDQTI